MFRYTASSRHASTSPERIQWFIEEQAFLRLHAHPLPPLSLCLPVCRRSSLLTGDGGGGRGRAWSRIIRPQESLALYKSFNPLCTWHICSCPFCFNTSYLWRHLLHMFSLLPYSSVIKQTFSRRSRTIWCRVADPGSGCGSGSSGSECPNFAKK